EIEQLKNDLETYAKSATFSGGNWLHVDEKSTQSVVASFVREGDAVSLAPIDVDTAKTALFTTAEDGLLQGTISVTPGGTSVGGLGDFFDDATLNSDGDGTASIDDFGDANWAEGDTVQF